MMVSIMVKQLSVGGYKWHFQSSMHMFNSFGPRDNAQMSNFKLNYLFNIYSIHLVQDST